MEIEKIALDTIVPSRSKFQLEKFVIGQHDTPQMQWRQIILEVQTLQYSMQQAKLDQEILRHKINKLKTKNDEVSLIKAEKLRIDFAMNQRAIQGAEIELKCLAEIAEQIGYFSPEEIEQNQSEYWAKRLVRQAEIDTASIREGISAGNIQSLLNAGLLNEAKEIK